MGKGGYPGPRYQRQCAYVMEFAAGLKLVLLKLQLLSSLFEEWALKALCQMSMTLRNPLGNHC